MNKFVLIGTAGPIAQAYTLEEANRLIDEAELQGFDVLDLIYVDERGFIQDCDFAADIREEIRVEDLDLGSAQFEDWEIPY